ncbi:Acetyl-coenzyme A synthetase [uncultured archaeon]|nr:Acetyl-coenzyme A synthetase [uncultured archaeon]
MDIWQKAEKEIILHDKKLNIVESCVDRHAQATPNKPALIFQSEKGNKKTMSYKELEKKTNKFANLLKELKLKQNSRVFIFLPKCEEIYTSFLGTIKHGSIAIPLFEAFESEGLELRLSRGDANVVVTNKELAKRMKKMDHRKVIVIDSDEYKKQIENCSEEFKPVLKDKKETAFMIFTSSTAGTPIAGVEISHYALVQQHSTAQLVLDLKENDKYWCTAHPGWVTGTVYGIIAPLSIGCTNYIYEGHFDSKKWIQFIKENKISVIYTAPTALRMLKGEINKEDLSTVRNICSVGEALTDTVFNFYKKLGIEINDTYWQSETGAMMIANWPALKKKPGSMGKPLPGIKAKIREGTISFEPPWPGMMTGIYRHENLYKSYFKNKLFTTNDLATIDKQGYFFFTGRKDDMIKTSGERVSPIEIESILMRHKAVKEVAVIGIPDQVKGQIIKAFIVLQKSFSPSDKLKEELSMFVKKNYAGHAYPKEVQFMESLPKTNSGKIIRMKLRQDHK